MDILDVRMRALNIDFYDFTPVAVNYLHLVVVFIYKSMSHAFEISKSLDFAEMNLGKPKLTMWFAFVSFRGCSMATTLTP
jgi:hypothetical protein